MNRAWLAGAKVSASEPRGHWFDYPHVEKVEAFVDSHMHSVLAQMFCVLRYCTGWRAGKGGPAKKFT